MIVTKYFGDEKGSEGNRCRMTAIEGIAVAAVLASRKRKLHIIGKRPEPVVSRRTEPAIIVKGKGNGMAFDIHEQDVQPILFRDLFIQAEHSGKKDKKRRFDDVRKFTVVLISARILVQCPPVKGIDM